MWRKPDLGDRRPAAQLGRPDGRRAIVVLVLLVGGVRACAIVPNPAIGVGFLYLVPALTAAVWFSPWGGLGSARQRRACLSSVP